MKSVTEWVVLSVEIPFSVPQFYELHVAAAALRPWWPLYLRHMTWYCGPRDGIHCSHHTQLEYAVLWILFLATVWATNNHGVCVIILFIITDSSDCSFRHAVVLYQVKFSLDVGVVYGLRQPANIFVLTGDILRNGKVEDTCRQTETRLVMNPTKTEVMKAGAQLLSKMWPSLWQNIAIEKE